MWLQRSRPSHDPFHHLLPLSAVDFLFDAMAAPPTRKRAGPSRLRVDSSDEGFRLTGVFPGVRAEDIELKVAEDNIEIQVERKLHAPEGYTPIRQEREGYAFERRIALPHRIDPDRVVASFENGLLRVDLVRSEADAPRSIEITSKEQ